MTTPDAVHAVILGTAQDGGFPQAGCDQPCCSLARVARLGPRLPACVGLVDLHANQRFLIDATWALPQQLATLGGRLDGILLTHAHMGHYTGLVHLGNEALATTDLPVYAMPRMAQFLRENAPWSGLIRRRHIRIEPLAPNRPISLTPNLRAEPILVPHRDEYSETVAFVVEGPDQSILHLPDIDQWEGWVPGLEALLARVDAAWIDGTFYDTTELTHREPGQIPHPLITDTIRRLASLPAALRSRVRLTHLNHTNPVLDPHSPQAAESRRAGLQVATPGELFSLGSP
jgi:pyrroloquinoline quinone biosynthesis protein B